MNLVYQGFLKVMGGLRKCCTRALHTSHMQLGLEQGAEDEVGETDRVQEPVLSQTRSLKSYSLCHFRRQKLK